MNDNIHKTKFKKSDDLTNIDKYLVTANIILKDQINILES